MGFEDALAEIEKKHGVGSLMKMSDKPPVSVDSLSTGSISLDRALGIGGLPRGRIVETFGPESSGKTTIALHVVAEAQRKGERCVYIDAEHSLDPQYAEAIGVKVDDLYIVQPDTGEQALDIVDTIVQHGGVAVVVIDSVAALVPRAELEGDMGDAHIGLQARLINQAMRKLTGNLARSNTLCIFINQLRDKIGVMFGSPETTTGGKALKFYASVRLDIRRIESLKEGAEIVGNRTRVKVVKNKVGVPHKKAEFDILYGEGINWYGDLIDVAVEEGVVQKAGAWFSYGGEKLGQGREKTKQFLISNPEISSKIESEVQTRLNLC